MPRSPAPLIAVLAEGSSSRGPTLWCFPSATRVWTWWCPFETFEHLPEPERFWTRRRVSFCREGGWSAARPTGRFTARPRAPQHSVEPVPRCDGSHSEFTAALARRFRNCRHFGQNPIGLRRARLMTALGRALPGNTAVRLNQATKLTRFIARDLKRYRVEPFRPDRAYEIIMPSEAIAAGTILRPLLATSAAVVVLLVATRLASGAFAFGLWANLLLVSGRARHKVAGGWMSSLLEGLKVFNECRLAFRRILVRSYAPDEPDRFEIGSIVSVRPNYGWNRSAAIDDTSRAPEDEKSLHEIGER